jgi:hypothetical protein
MMTPPIPTMWRAHDRRQHLRDTAGLALLSALLLAIGVLLLLIQEAKLVDPTRNEISQSYPSRNEATRSEPSRNETILLMWGYSGS